MGPGRAAEIIREGLFRGADGGYLLTDRAFAGADTLATSYALSMALRKIGKIDLIISGRQAIDGDTAQVGPQVAEKSGMAQITYAEEIQSIENGKIRVTRRLERGVEIVEGNLPMVVTVNGTAPECRPRNARLLQKYKHALTITEKQAASVDYEDLYRIRPYLNLEEWSVADVKADVEQCGLSGSPTKVKKIENVVFQAKESKTFDSSDTNVEELIVELINNHTIG
jgi:electron transfer flavoprotein beta subunit